VAGALARGDVRLFRFPAPDKQRPVLVLTRTSALRFLGRVTVAPITSTIREIPTEVVLDEGDGVRSRCAVSLDNVITVPRAGLGRRITSLSPEKMSAVCHALEFAVGCYEAGLNAQQGAAARYHLIPKARSRRCPSP
jgi:mRNA interferase MazF